MHATLTYAYRAINRGACVHPFVYACMWGSIDGDDLSIAIYVNEEELTMNL